MKILVVGSGGREHALVWKLKQSPQVEQIFCAPGNGGIGQIATCVDIKATDIEGMVAFAKENQIDLTVVAPDDPLVMGMVDAFEQNGLRAFGPRKNAAIIEGSKVFAKELMQKYNIATAQYQVFDKVEEATTYLKTQTFPIVIKAEGLALGKGVIIAQSFDEAVTAVREMLEDKKFGTAGNRVVVEQFLTGQEVSVLAFTDGKTIVPMVSAQDHKRAYDNDQGLNTGGMGAFSPSRIYDAKTAQYCYDNIFLPTMHAMNAEGRPFQGVLYFGLIVTNDGVYVIEYNCRFGDPETQAVLPRLGSDLLPIFEAIIDQKLDTVPVEWDDGAACCVVMASGGYPEGYQSGYAISGLDQAAQLDNITVFHAGTKQSGGDIVTAGGRVLGVTATGGTLDDAIKQAYEGVSRISFAHAHYRKDIGVK